MSDINNILYFEEELNSKINTSFVCLIEALKNIAPIANKIGIESSIEKKYDEWEDITQVLFDNFVIFEIRNTKKYFNIDNFRGLGGKLNKKFYDIGIIVNDKKYLLFDIVSFDGINFLMLLFEIGMI